MRHLFAAAAPARDLDALPGAPGRPRSDGLVQSYRQRADVFHEILSEHTVDNLLERIADTLAELVPYDTLSIYQADEAQMTLTPVLARDQWADNIMNSPRKFGEGITGWAALHREPVRTNQAHLDPRMKVVPGTPPDEPEALITVPLIARDAVKGALNIYRLGEEAEFSDEEFELARRGRRAQPGAAPHRFALLGRVRPGREDHHLDRHLAGPPARDEPARAGGLRRGRDDDLEGPRQEPDRPLRRDRQRAARDPGR